MTAGVDVSRLFSLAGEVVAVTGASSGIGLAIAEAAASAGARVALVGRDADRLGAARRRLAEHGQEPTTHVADVADRAAVRAAVADIHDSHGRLDVVVANAGIGAGPSLARPGGTLAEYPVEDWDRVVATNLSGVFHTLQAAAGVLPSGGRVLVTASTAGLRADPMVGYGYGAAKAGVVNLVKHAALDLAPRGIRVNALVPGPFRTNIGGRPMDDDRERAWAATVPLGRVGEPADIHGPALLLMSHASGFITGAALAVDGGALASSPGGA